jgi:selenocysteine lyase/cysteine desulfurase
MSAQLRSVTEAGLAAVAAKSHPWDVTSEDFFTGSEYLRGLFAKLIAGDVEGVALIPSVSYGVGTAAANTQLASGDRIVLLDDQFPSNVYPWRAAAEATGAEVVTVPRPADHDWTSAVLETIDARTAVVATANIHWTDGSLIDVAAVAAAARAVGAIYVIDATQSLGSLPLDVTVVQADYVIAAGYKGLLGPYSLGYMWMGEPHRLGIPLEQNWIARAGSEDFAGLVDYKSDYQPGARRFDVGERSNFVLIPMATAALTQILTWGVSEISEYVSRLTAAAEAEATAMGLLPIPAARRGPNMMGVRVPGGPPGDLGRRLAADDIYVSIRGDSIRIAPHVYNEPADIDRLFHALSRLL